MKFANPAPLGLFGFATTTWLLSMLNAGWFPIVKDLPLMMATAFAFGGVAQFIAGLLEYPRGNTFGFVAFTCYGSFWFAFALYIEALPRGELAFQGAFLLVWGMLTALLFITIETATVFWILLEFGKKIPPCTPIKHGEEET